MARFNCENRVELFAEQNNLEVVVHGSLVQSLLKARMLLEVQQMENRVVYEAVFEIVAVKDLLHDLSDDFGIVHALAVYHEEQRNSRRVGSRGYLFVNRTCAFLSLEKHNRRNACFCKFSDCFALCFGIFLHPRKSRENHGAAVSVAGKCLRRCCRIQHGHCFDAVIHVLLTGHYDTFSKRLQLQAVFNCYFHPCPLLPEDAADPPPVPRPLLNSQSRTF